MAVLLAAIVFFAQIVGGKGLPAKGYVLSRARGVERGILLKEGGAGRIFRGGRAIMGPQDNSIDTRSVKTYLGPSGRNEKVLTPSYFSKGPLWFKKLQRFRSMRVASKVTEEDKEMVTSKARLYNQMNLFIDNPWIGLLSSVIICTGALYEAFEAVEDLAHCNKGINKSALGLGILALGHFLHYFKELLKHFIELDEAFEDRKKSGEIVTGTGAGAPA
ncbi:hypothetical protein AAMO2058_000570400 [Amorphochlora amoebiformis]